MSDFRDDKSDQPGGPAGAAGRGAGGREDPLAELARLIDEDPFADFDRGRQADAERGAEPDDAYDAGPEEAAWPESAPYEPESGQDYADQVEAALGEAERDHYHSSAGEFGDYDDPAADASASWDAPAEAHAAEGAPDAERPRFDAVSAVAAHLFGEGARGGAAAGEAPHADWSIVRPPEAHDIVRPPADPAPAAQPAYNVRLASDYEEADEGRDWQLDQNAGSEYAAADERPYDGSADDELGHAEAGYVYAESDPVYDGDGHMPPHDLDLGARRPRRGLAVIGGLVGLVVLGGAVALGYRGLSNDPAGEPPVIRAEAAPTKVIAEAEEADPNEGQSKLVYDRIVGASSEAEERLVSREEPVFEVEGRDQVVRQIEPGTGLRGGQDEALEQTADADADEPRRVRTVVVRPDGTVVSPPAAAPTTETLPGAATDALRIAQGAEIEASDNGAGATGTTGTQTTALSPGATQPQAEFVPPSAAQPEPQPAEPQPAEQQAAPEPAAEPQQAAQQQAEAQQPQQAAQQQAAQPRAGQPLQLVPNPQAPQQNTQVAAAPSAPSPAPDAGNARQPFASGGYVVQVASTRAEEEARGAAATLAERHGGLVGSYRVGVERADLGDRGIFYRVGIGDITSQSDANALCDRLKSNGLDCFVRRN